MVAISEKKLDSAAAKWISCSFQSQQQNLLTTHVNSLNFQVQGAFCEYSIALYAGQP